MKRTEMALTAFALTAGVLAGCRGDTEPQSAEPDAGGPGRRDEQQCLRTEDLVQVLPPSVLGGGSSFTQLTVDSSHVYFSMGTSLYRVSTEGGPAEELFTGATSYGLAFSVQDGRVLVATDTAVLELTEADEPHVLTQLPEAAESDLFTGTMPFVFAGQHAYFVGSTRSNVGPTFYSVDLSSGLSTSLGVATDDVGVLMQLGDALYWTESSTDPAAPYANTLMRLPVSGGVAEEVPVDLGTLHLAFDLLGTTSDAVVLDVSLVLGADNSDNAAVTAAGIYSQPVGGGKALQWVEAAAFDLTDLFGIAPSVQAVQAGDQLFLRSGTFQSVTIYSLAQGASTPEERFCVLLGDALVESMAVVNGSVYLALADDDGSYIVRRDL